MKFSGITRKIDSLGRIVIPVDIRRHLNWTDDTSIEINLFGKYLLLRAEVERQSEQIIFENTNPVTDELLINIPKLDDYDAFIILELIQRLVNGKAHANLKMSWDVLINKKAIAFGRLPIAIAFLLF